MPKYTIVIPTHRHLSDCLKPCIESIKKYTTLKNIEILIVANGCGNDGTAEYVKKLGKPFRLICIKEQVGYTKAANEGLRQAKGDYIVLLNNDTILLEQVKDTWLNMLNDAFNNPVVGISGPMMTYSPSAGRDFLIFFCVMISRHCINGIGYLDEVFAPAYGEDTDYGCRAVDVGFELAQVPKPSSAYYADKRMVGEFPIYHEGNVSYKNWPGGEDLIRRNEAILHDRYNNSKLDTCSESIDISKALQCDGYMSETELKWLAGQAKQRELIVEIGSWHGRSSRALLDNLMSEGRLVCVDHWLGSEVERTTNHASATLAEGDHAFLEFLRNTFDRLKRVLPLRLSSKNAAELFKWANVSFDMIFIDAGHTYEEVKKDILRWAPLLSEDGILCGHDYQYTDGMWPGVTKAVDELIENPERVPATNIWHGRLKNSTQYEFRDFIAPAPYVPKVYDCFPFFNELDILEIRFNELFDVVDRFVIVEATKTHSGNPKPLYFRDNLQRFEKFLHKVTHIMIDDYPEVPAEASVTDKAWAIERHQRDCIMRGLTECDDRDMIIISDCDEIPNESMVSSLKKMADLNHIYTLEMTLYYYDFTCKAVDKWQESKVTSYNIVKQLKPCGVRYAERDRIAMEAGWHFSYFGTIDNIIHKIESGPHQEYNTDMMKDPERIEYIIEKCMDLYGRDLKYVRSNPMDSILPKFVINKLKTLESVNPAKNNSRHSNKKPIRKPVSNVVVNSSAKRKTKRANNC